MSNMDPKNELAELQLKLTKTVNEVKSSGRVLSEAEVTQLEKDRDRLIELKGKVNRFPGPEQRPAELARTGQPGQRHPRRPEHLWRRQGLPAAVRVQVDGAFRDPGGRQGPRGRWQRGHPGCTR